MGKVKDAAKKAKDIVVGNGSNEKSGLSRKSSSASLKSVESRSSKGNDLASTPGVMSKKDKRKMKQELSKQSEFASEEETEDESEDDLDVEPKKLEMSKLDESDSESDIMDEDADDDEKEEDGDEESEDEEEDGDEESEDEEEDEDVPLSDVELDEDADVIPHEKTTVNNTAALKQALKNIQLPTKELPFFEHLSVTSEGPIVMKDIYDDMERELCFYKQGLETVKKARKQLLKDKVPFSRPTDYFAEMVKSDEHMDKLKKKLYDEAASKKASQDAKRQRELKKFGKKVQNVKLQERAKEKRQMLENVKSLKKKGGGLTTDDDFEVALQEAAASQKSNNAKPEKGTKRKAKDAKYGSGGRKRFKNSNDAKSSSDLSGFNPKKMKASSQQQKKRPGKSKRGKN